MRRQIAIGLFICLAAVTAASAAGNQDPNYPMNRAPLLDKPYAELPLGAIAPQGWLRVQLQRMADGMTGRLDELYPAVCGDRNAWLGGDGDTWERGPYWIDGLYPLAELLDRDDLRQKARKWVEWTLANQRPDGQIGPFELAKKDRKQPPPSGAQIHKPDDWWPRMVMLKILQQHYMATGDPRVIDCLTKYFRYQLKELPSRPLHDPKNPKSGSWWAEQRGGDNLLVVYWLYNITGDRFLLELGDLIHKQTLPFTDLFLAHDMLESNKAFHCVNLAQGIKAPIVRFQADGNEAHLKATATAFADIRKYHGQPHSLYGGDEGLHGTGLTRGSELCTAVEMMFSLEKMVEITGNTAYADRLEMIAYNLLPTQTSDDQLTRQYFQQANQVACTYGDRNFYNDNGDRIVYGLTSGYPCCTCNLHQGWPKFTQHLWMASKDRGLAALLYGPCEVTARVADGQTVTITESTAYPMEDRIVFTVKTKAAVAFPLHLRIPEWCSNPSISINGTASEISRTGQVASVSRTWKDGDRLELNLPAELRTDRWEENSASLYRGPLLFALKIGEQWSEMPNPNDRNETIREARPASPWNFALIEQHLSNPGKHFTIRRAETVSDYFWDLEHAPITITAKGVRLPEWQLYGDSAGPIPWSTRQKRAKTDQEEITLVPYGCSTLRISAFPTCNLKE